MDYNNPLSGDFSISSKILIHFGLTFFMVYPFLSDNRWGEVRSPFWKVFFLIVGRQKCRQSDKP